MVNTVEIGWFGSMVTRLASIAAASIVERIPLLTRDKRIRKSKLVPFA
jgi:hypothetical protein